MNYARQGMLLFAALISIQLAAGGTLTMITTRVGLGGNDFINWGQLGPDSTDKQSPFAVTTSLGNTAVVANGTHFFESQQQGNSWAGNFAAGDNLLVCCDFNSSPTAGPYTITFPSAAMAVGAQFSSLDYGPFTASITAFGAGDVNFGSVTESGTSNGAGNNSAIFLGVTSTAYDIVAIQLNVVFGGANDPFATNRMELSDVPEPNSLLLAGAGFVPVYLLLRKRARARK